MTRTRSVCLPVLAAVVLSTLALVAVPLARAGADTAPPAGYSAGTGNFEGSESATIDNEQFLGIPCFKATDLAYDLQGAGTYQGVTAGGQPVVYNAQITAGQTLYGNGPIHIEVENTETYYHGPQGTAGPNDTTCSTSGIDVTAVFRIWATDHVYQLDNTNAQVPCVGHGVFSRGPNSQTFHAQWTLDSDCTVVGNAAGTPGTGLARAGTGFTDVGNHGPCFDSPCANNIKFDYTQYLPFVGLHLGLSGPATNKVNTVAAMFAHLTNDGQPVAGSAVTFSVSGPAATSPTGATATTGADGAASFNFTANTVGSYVVTATTPSNTPGQTITATQTVQITPPAPPTVKLSGPAGAQTEESVYLAGTFTNDDQPTQNVQVHFSVTGAGTATPATGTVTTDADGLALFNFVGDKAGNYTITASATYSSQQTTDTLTIPLQINNFSRQGTLAVGGPPVIDPAGDYAYFGGNQIVKVDLHTFQQVATLQLPSGEGRGPGVIDAVGNYAYFANNNINAPNNFTPCGACITKIDLHSFQRVGFVALQSDELQLRSATIDPAGHFGYFGFNHDYTAPGRVAKVDLDTLQEVGTITFPADETSVDTAIMSPAGDFAYFGARGANSLPARLVKVDLATFQRVGSLSMADASENNFRSSLIDPAGHYAYFALHQAAFGSASNPEHIVKVDLTTFSRVASITLEGSTAYFHNPESDLGTAVMDPAGNFAYFGMGAAGSSPSGLYYERILRIDLRTFEKGLPITVTDTVRGFSSAAIAPDGNHAYFVYSAGVMKIALNRPPNPALAAANDTYSTNYLTPLTVFAPGVLANDVNNANGDPLVAGQASTPGHGTVALNPDGSFTYTPNAGFSGTDTFTYTASNLRDYSAPTTVSVNVGAAPVGVSAVGGGACGYYTNVGLFGGPQALEGCGQPEATPATSDQVASRSPSVSLAPTGSAGPITATTTEGAMGRYGPAAIFSGIWPDNVAAAPPSGPLSVSTQGTTGPGGSVTSSAGVVLRSTPLAVRCVGDPTGTTNCTAPGGIGPGPLNADQAHSTCTANQSGLSGSASFVNGHFDAKYDVNTQLPIVVKDIPPNPPPNYTLDGTLDHVGDSFRVVFNEQLLTPDSITVNAAHMYLLGPTAVGEMIVGQSRCAITADAPDAAPTAANDTYTASAGHRLVVSGAGVLANDTDADFGPLRASKQLAIAPPPSGGGVWTFPSDPANGTLALGADGSFVYTPNQGFIGTDSFTYVAQDARGRSSAPATVTVNVVDAPDGAPVANNDAGYVAVSGAPVTVGAPGVLANDTDPENDTLTAGSASNPAHGRVTLNPDGSFTYTPDATFAGTDTFTYAANDGFGGSSTATVAVVVNFGGSGPTTLAVNDITLNEGSGGTTAATFTIARSGTISGTTTVKVKTANGTATAPSDYTAVPLTTVTFTPGQTTLTVAVNVVADTFFEKNETFNLLLSTPVGATIIDGSGKATIVNDDPPPILSVNDVTVTEGNSGTTPATFTITRAGNTTGAVSVKVHTAYGTATAGSDYTAVPLTTVSFADGETTKSVTVNVNGDTGFEKDETFNLVLTAPLGATISDPSGIATILNDDDPATLAVNDVSVTEGNSGTTDAVFTITRSGNITGAASVKVKTSNGTATASSGDYTAVPLTTVSFVGGETTKTVTVHVNGDTLHENNETFNLVLSSPVGATITDGSGKATIVNDD